MTITPKWYGEILSVQGITEAGVSLSRYELQSSLSPPEKALSVERIWPENEKSPGFFQRLAHSSSAQDMELQSIEPAESSLFCGFLERRLLPAEVSVSPQQVVWVAGTKTWKQLAKRGVWVTGCSDSLGEEESPGLEILTGLVQIPRLKLTHTRGRANHGTKASDNGDAHSAETLASSQPGAIAVGGKVAGDLFLVATSSLLISRAARIFSGPAVRLSRKLRALFPEIRSAHHASGPGHTHQVLRECLGEAAQLSIHLDYAAWRAAVLPLSGQRPGAALPGNLQLKVPANLKQRRNSTNT